MKDLQIIVPPGKASVHFVLVPERAGHALHDQSLHVYMINLLPYVVDFEMVFSFEGHQEFELKKSVPSQKSFFIATLTMDDLNDFPAFSIRLTNTDIEIEKTIKPKAKQIIRGPEEVTFLNQPCFNTVLYAVDPIAVKPPAVRKQQPEAPEIDPVMLKEMMLGGWEPREDKVALGHSAEEVDLHFEHLAKDANCFKLDSGQKLDIQLRSFERFLENAIARGMASITVIHGIGKGKLKKAIHRILDEHPCVRHYEAPKSGRYGTGATEVFF